MSRPELHEGEAPPLAIPRRRQDLPVARRQDLLEARAVRIDLVQLPVDHKQDARGRGPRSSERRSDDLVREAVHRHPKPG